MWIINDNAATSRIYNDELMDKPVAFNASGTVQVPEEVGEAMVAHYDSIRPSEAEDTDETTES
jgi:hypothetical protein